MEKLEERRPVEKTSALREVKPPILYQIQSHNVRSFPKFDPFTLGKA